MNTATWRIGRLALMLACIGLLALSTTRWAEAAESNPSSNGSAQVQWCESMGGTADVQEVRTVGGGLGSVVVTCSGGLGGSWHCGNFIRQNPDCKSSRGRLPDWGNLDSMVAASDDDQNQDQDQGKRQAKKGKKGGKGRKK